LARVTISDIADALELSPTTVSFVLNGREMGISAETRDRVLQKAHELNYSRVSRAVMSGWTRVAYLIENPADLSRCTTFFTNVFNNLRELAFEKRIETLMYEFKPDQEPELAHQRLEMFKNLDIRMFLTNSGNIAKALLRGNHKVILIQGGGIVEGCTCIYCDDYNAGVLAAKHFYELGHRVAGTVFPNNDNSPRYDGFTETFLNLGGDCPLQFEWTIGANHLESAGKLNRLFKKIDKMPTAIYCFADNYMYPVIRALQQQGLRVPDDVSLIGSDMLYWGQIATPAFSTVDLQERLFAEKVLDTIDDMLNDKPVYQIAIPVKLVSGETVKDLR
jgi:DNA-binding LacI/PurR family transcriptional regulator